MTIGLSIQIVIYMVIIATCAAVAAYSKGYHDRLKDEEKMNKMRAKYYTKARDLND